MTRRGPRMEQVCAYVKKHPGCTRDDVANALRMPHSSASAAVTRTIRAGLVQAKRDGAGPDVLFPAEKVRVW